MRASPRSTPTSDSLRQVLTPNPYSSSTHLSTLSTLSLILTHMHLLYKVSVYLRATKRKVPPPSLDEEIEKRHVKRVRSTFGKLSEIFFAEDESNKLTQKKRTQKKRKDAVPEAEEVARTTLVLAAGCWLPE
ncbi:hypothetical protein ALC56_09740 [Trachymyrmex septentrionalis]|uniref:Uncharacterized protein n=1 Tax=Trachymyrmex septentrionalis TaxID=34720 RepID=A0A195F7A1_9HYME|nr:hypothetical protein ALC56_09740 [Trachymyrmex septentrionalis]